MERSPSSSYELKRRDRSTSELQKSNTFSRKLKSNATFHRGLQSVIPGYVASGGGTIVRRSEQSQAELKESVMAPKGSRTPAQVRTNTHEWVLERTHSDKKQSPIGGNRATGHRPWKPAPRSTRVSCERNRRGPYDWDSGARRRASTHAREPCMHVHGHAWAPCIR
jgi:hypothetical protein